MIEKDKRKNNIGDRIKHICHHVDSIEKLNEVKKTGQLMIDKEFILLKADLKHLTDDIYGIENKEENNGS